MSMSHTREYFPIDNSMYFSNTDSVATERTGLSRCGGSLLATVIMQPKLKQITWYWEDKTKIINDVDFDLGTSAGGGQIIDEEAILDDGGSAVTWTANAPLYIIQNSHGHAANQFVSTSTTAGVVGGPATSEAIVIAGTLYTSAARTLHARLKALNTDLATAATTVTYLVQFLHLGATPDQ